MSKPETNKFFDINKLPSEIVFPKFNEKKIKEILVERHEFSEERIENQFEKMNDFNEKAKQKGLEKWF